MKYLLNGEQSRRLGYGINHRSCFDSWIEFFNHRDTARLLGPQDIGSPLDQCEDWIRRLEERYYNQLGGMNALIDRNTGQFVGQGGLLIQEVDEHKELEIECRFPCIHSGTETIRYNGLRNLCCRRANRLLRSI